MQTGKTGGGGLVWTSCLCPKKKKSAKKKVCISIPKYQCTNITVYLQHLHFFFFFFTYSNNAPTAGARDIINYYDTVLPNKDKTLVSIKYHCISSKISKYIATQ